MRTILILLTTLSLSAQPPANYAAKADAYLQSWTRDGLFRGSVLVAHQGQPIFRKGYGLANSEWDIPNAPDTKFRLGSITKQFTATVILQLAEQGKLALTDPVSKHYPEAPAAWEKITIHHLLNHTSGIPSYTSLPGFFANRSQNKLSPVEIVKLTQDKPLEFEPGSKNSYNNTAYVLLGHIIERVTGEKYDAVLRKQIFSPLDMNDSGYDWPTPLLKKRASGYSPDGSNAPFLDMSLPHAAGSLYSTVDDLLRWDQALYTEKMLKPESFAKLITPKEHPNYGYGLQIGKDDGHAVQSHGGGINGFNTDIRRYPDDKLTVIVLCNQNSPAIGPIATNLARLYFGKDIQPRPVRKFVTLTTEQLDAVTGEYEIKPGQIFKITRKDNRLMVQPPGQPPLPAEAIDATRFYLKPFDGKFTFEKDAEGKFTAVSFSAMSRPAIRAVRK